VNQILRGVFLVCRRNHLCRLLLLSSTAGPDSQLFSVLKLLLIGPATLSMRASALAVGSNAARVRMLEMDRRELQLSDPGRAKHMILIGAGKE
jgi:hypothetical protein